MRYIANTKEMARTATQAVVTLLDIEEDLVGDLWSLSSLNSAEHGRKGNENKNKGRPDEHHDGREEGDVVNSEAFQATWLGKPQPT